MDMKIIKKYLLNEIKKEVVVRGNKRIKRYKPKKGYKIVDGKYVKMTASEKLRRKKASIKAAKKRRSQKNVINRKRQKSLKKRI